MKKKKKISIFVSAAFNSNMMCVCMSVYKESAHCNFPLPLPSFVYIQQPMWMKWVAWICLQILTVNIFSSVWQLFYFERENCNGQKLTKSNLIKHDIMQAFSLKFYAICNFFLVIFGFKKNSSPKILENPWVYF